MSLFLTKFTLNSTSFITSFITSITSIISVISLHRHFYIIAIARRFRITISSITIIVITSRTIIIVLSIL
ncbi:hypothetical protein C7974DRAFT_402814 [Boeremia exigua]|uniref:uncharacterized protein n=1 Tax=Boeremia exigua TaxID=749465 RepID=UPI001E8DC95C|nr:uncharacterized protein C7974DRAFT_405157 [Boeremia exigua]XP_045992507.1 uncharacterized protein C7974DRAFT_402814 [Boeremia exigua]KAH6613101.1 hypothetical protein C7974DRAFT_405157 [Boeremia exigua]KAH6614873.1 hypothetical protein C7974DRAFT_402814 [Boeremia exigua]